MSACFSFALTAGNPIGDAAAKAGTDALWTGLPKLVVVLLGGFTTNFIWCAMLNLKNGTGYQYFSSTIQAQHTVPTVSPAAESSHGGGGTAVRTLAPAATATTVRAPMLNNYFFSALAGVTWYMQFFFYTMGETQMGKFGFASWTLHMASIIIFSTMWGWIFHEWKGSSKKAHTLIASGIVTLILSTIIIGFGTWLKGQAGGGH
jgi:L-rhamnose-H+ transport protein